MNTVGAVQAGEVAGAWLVIGWLDIGPDITGNL